MFKKILLAVAVLIATMGFAFAQVDVNKADQAALDGVKGIGPKLSKTILDERKKGGDFKDWADFQKRVKGIGDKSSDNLSKNGLMVNGRSKPNAPAAAVAKSDSKKENKAQEAGKGDKAATASAAVPAAASGAQTESKKNAVDSKAKDKKADKASASASAKK